MMPNAYIKVLVPSVPYLNWYFDFNKVFLGYYSLKSDQQQTQLFNVWWLQLHSQYRTEFKNCLLGFTMGLWNTVVFDERVVQLQVRYASWPHCGTPCTPLTVSQCLTVSTRHHPASVATTQLGIATLLRDLPHFSQCLANIYCKLSTYLNYQIKTLFIMWGVSLLRAVPESTGPGVRVGRVRSLDRRGFSEQVAAPTRLSCPGFSRG